LGIDRLAGIDTSLKVALWILGGALAIAGLFALSEGWLPEGSGVGVAAATVKAIMPLAAPVVTSLMGLLQWYRAVRGEPLEWDAIQRVIETQRTVIMDRHSPPTQTPRLRSEMRLTLFKFTRPWYSPKRWLSRSYLGPGVLIPVARTNSPQRSGIRSFPIKENGQLAEAGVAGRVWRSEDGWTQIDGLPEITANSSEADLMQYALSTHCTVESVRQNLADKRPFPRAFAGCKVLVTNDREWGVLVVDSAQPGRIDLSSLEAAVPFFNLLTPLLQRI